MKVSTRLSLAQGTLIGILLLLLVFHLGTLRTVVSTGYTLAEASRRLVQSTSLQLGRLNELEESASKYAVTLDAGYLRRFDAARSEFAAEVRRFLELDLSPGEREEAEALLRLWEAFEEDAAALAPERHPVGPLDEARLAALRARLDALRAQVRGVGRATREALDATLVRSAEIVRRAEWLSWSAAGLGLLLGAGLGGLVVRSLSRSLRRLREGTREIAGGRFDFRLALDHDDELADLAHDFNLMSLRLGELDRVKRDFVSNVSHDLKTPLASMQEITRALLDEVPGPLTPRQRQLLGLHHQSGRRLSSMISNLLDLAAMEAGALDLRVAPCDLGALLRAAVDSMEPARAMRGVEIALRGAEAPIPAECDEDRVLQVVVNLLDNAVRFSPPGGRVVVEASLPAERPPGLPRGRWPGPGAALVSVSDSGPGIAPGERERVFERFYQGGNGRRGRRRGVGLGLAICREIVQAHGGSAWVEASPDGGSTFHVLLPRARTAAGVEPRAARAAPAPRPASVPLGRTGTA